MWPVSNWHGSVMFKAVLFEAQGGENRFPAAPLALLSWFKSVTKGLGRVWAFRNSQVKLAGVNKLALSKLPQRNFHTEYKAFWISQCPKYF